MWGQLHPSIMRVAEPRFRPETYADSVQASMTEVNARVRRHLKTQGREELDGSRGMFQAFSLDAPVIRVADTSTVSGKDQQEGYMYLFAGAMKGIRNPKAHDNVTIDEGRATHFLWLASLLMHKLDEAGVPP